MSREYLGRGRKEHNMDSCVHIYCGEGKGKDDGRRRTGRPRGRRRQKGTAYPVLKTDHSGEGGGAGADTWNLGHTSVRRAGFFFRMTEEQKKEAAVYYTGAAGYDA